jgi:hypothetical protein
MGLFRALVMLPLAPMSGVRWVAVVLAGEAERELAERESPQRALAELDAKRANGEISDEYAEVLEGWLIEQMLSGHGLNGGP